MNINMFILAINVIFPLKKLEQSHNIFININIIQIYNHLFINNDLF